jgi:histidine ammonia-lyase
MSDARTVMLDGRGLTPAAVEAVARCGAPVELSGAARERNAAAGRALDEMVAGGEAVYGITTGVGPFRTRAVPPELRGDQQLRLLRSHASGAGPELPPERVRAAMVVRANQLGAGGAGVSDALLDALVGALNGGFTPSAHAIGSLGTGDLTVLAEIALALIDEYGLELGSRDGLGFMSSNAEAIGHAALVASDAARVLEHGLEVAALSFVAADADQVVLDPRVHEARPHPGQVAVAARMRELLGTAPGARRPLDGEAGPSGEARPVQDPFPYRAFPQVEGTARDALATLERVVEVEMNAAAENPLIAEAAILPNANFHAGALSLALDGFRAALAQSASLRAERVTAMLEPRLTGLPPMLASDAGPGSGAMMLEYTAHAGAAQVRALAAPVASQTTVVGGGVESHASFAPVAAGLTERALDAAAVVLATELVVAVRAIRMSEREPAGIPVAELFARAAAVLAPDVEDRPLAADLEAARRLLVGNHSASRR